MTSFQSPSQQRSLPQVSLLLFDLDGVLLDSKPNMEIAWRAVQNGLGIDNEFSSYFSNIGKPFHDIMNAMGLGNLAAEAEKIYVKTSLENISQLKWYDGVLDMLSTAKASGLKLGVVTSKDRSRTGALLGMLPVEFSTIQTPCAGLRGKPAPDHLLTACAQTNVDPGNVVYIGDMTVDYEAALRAGIDYAHAAWGYGAIPNQNCRVIRNVADIVSDLNLGRSL